METKVKKSKAKKEIALVELAETKIESVIGTTKSTQTVRIKRNNAFVTVNVSDLSDTEIFNLCFYYTQQSSYHSYNLDKCIHLCDIYASELENRNLELPKYEMKSYDKTRITQ